MFTWRQPPSVVCPSNARLDVNNSRFVSGYGFSHIANALEIGSASAAAFFKA